MNTLSGSLDRHTPAYGRSFPYYEENLLMHAAYGRRIAADIAAHAVRSALSLGIGHTEVARQILAKLRSGPLQRYVVVDGSPAIVATFQDSIAPAPPGLRVIEGFFETFEHDERFEVIEAGFILEHVEDPALVLGRMHRFIADGGRMYVAVPNARSLHRLLGHLAGMLPDLFELSEADLLLGHRRYFDVESLSSVATACGWRTGRIEGMLLKPFTTAQLAKLDLPPAVWQALQTAAAPYPEISNAFCMELFAAG